MKIVVLDGFTLNPGDLTWNGLRQIGECAIYERTAPAELLDRAQGAEVLLSNKTVVSRDHILHLPGLRYIGVLATGYNNIDVEAARARQIPVTNVPTYGHYSVAQMTFALLLELTHHAGHHAAAVREGRWSNQPDFCFWDYPLVELRGLTMGIVGFGRIGQEVGKLALAFGMRLFVHTPHPPAPWKGQVEFVSLEKLLTESDAVSLHCPLTNQTRALINRERLALFKPGAFLLNTSRGLLVDETALAEALNSGRIAGAGLDVLPVEPPKLSDPLLQAKNCWVTPHIAWATKAARQRLLDAAISNLKSFLAGKPENVVNGLNPTARRF